MHDFHGFVKTFRDFKVTLHQPLHCLLMEKKTILREIRTILFDNYNL